MSSELTRIEVFINVYDLLPPGRLSSFLWNVGYGLLHSGVQIENREFAFGGHAKHGVSGVYWTTPRLEPPGAVFRSQILMGVTFKSRDEVDDIIFEVSQSFLGPKWNLLSNNCNHFTSTICQLLTGNPAPTWLNRAANIGIALPCVLPKDWLTPPDAETAEGELLETDQEDDERAAMLRNAQVEPFSAMQTYDHSICEDENELDAADSFVGRFDSSGTPLPVSERAPAPR